MKKRGAHKKKSTNKGYTNTKAEHKEMAHIAHTHARTRTHNLHIHNTYTHKHTHTHTHTKICRYDVYSCSSTSSGGQTSMNSPAQGRAGPQESVQDSQVHFFSNYGDKVRGLVCMTDWMMCVGHSCMHFLMNDTGEAARAGEAAHGNDVLQRLCSAYNGFHYD